MTVMNGEQANPLQCIMTSNKISSRAAGVYNKLKD